MRDLTPPLLILCLLTLATGCQKQTVALDDLQEELETIKTEARQAKKMALNLKDQFQALTDSVEKMDKELTSARLSTRESAAQCAELESAFASYRKHYRESIQQRAPGMKLASFTTNSGSYQDVQIRQLDSWQVAIQHKDGFIKINLADLPEQLRNQLGYDPDIGPRPTEAVASTSNVNVYVPTSPAPPMSAAGATPVVATAPRPVLSAPTTGPVCPIEAAAKKTRAQESQERYGDGSIITSWGTSGSKIKSNTQALPQSYKPIGSSFSGSAMDQAYKDKNKSKAH